MKRPTKDTTIILEVLRFAHYTRTPIPEFVNGWRKELRARLREHRRALQRMRLHGRDKMADYCAKNLRRDRIMLRRVTHLQKRYASWRELPMGNESLTP